MKTRAKTGFTKTGFTLIELLVTMAIILVLVSIMIPTIRTARQKARKAMAFSEMKTLETAWREYLTTYRKPPMTRRPTNPMLRPVLEEKVPIRGDVARILKGEDIEGLNSKRQRFMEFNHVDSDGDPITPWGSLTASDNATGVFYYYVKFDKNFDHIVKAGAGEPTDPPNSNIGRDFIVWAFNPTVDPSDEAYVLRAWEQ